MKTIQREEIFTTTDEEASRILSGRWLFFLSVVGVTLVFTKEAFDLHLIIATLGLFFINLLISVLYRVTEISEESKLDYFMQLVGNLGDSLLLAMVISHTGGFTSPFIIGYACLTANIAENGRVSQIIIFGLIFHTSFAYALYRTYGSWEFYFSPTVLMITILFAIFAFREVYLARKIREQTIRLERSKSALEHFAEGLKSSNESIERLSYLDPVTSIYNFRYFRHLLTEEMDRAERYRTYLSLLIIDIDNFKDYNERFGHQKGDSVLKEIAGIIKNNIRELDVFARYIGDEFALALTDADSELAVIIGNRIKQAVEEHSFPGEKELPSGNLTVSIGIAVYPDNALTMEGLIKTAEDALYKVKLSRSNRIRVYSNIIGEIQAELSDSESLVDTLQTLLVVVNARDRYTYGHSERVVHYAEAIAKQLGLDKETLKELKYGAFLHDIGKIEIDREVLNKREPLTDEEWKLIKEHPQFGVSIIEPIRGLEGILGIVRHHHERFDGRGYPDGLKGAEIPLCARILAVADSYDAMMTNRPYRQALPKAVAIEELKRGKGMQFDPEIVDAFLEVVDQVDKEIEGLAS